MAKAPSAGCVYGPSRAVIVSVRVTSLRLQNESCSGLAHERLSYRRDIDRPVL